MSKALSFIKFQPQQFTKVWGGEKLHKFYGKPIGSQIGESWEISGVKGKVSELQAGFGQAHNLTELIAACGTDLLGARVYNKYHGEFPLLFKFIDAKQDLSVQLHPDDTIAQAQHGSFGKTEMWYVLQADPGARLVIGFKPGVDHQAYQRALSEGRITDILNEVPVQAGDAFFIAPGLVHAIGGGVVLAEIQQTSDITYRIYDWDRPDVNGAMRELHLEEAARALVFHDMDQVDCRPERRIDNAPNLIYASDYFQTTLWPINASVSMNTDPADSFMVLMCVFGSAQLIAAGQPALRLECGETALVPACMGEFTVESSGAEILEVIVP